MTAARDRRFMALALGLGRRGMGRVWPNPAVGCVIVQGDMIVGRGWTADSGRPHAETCALAQAGSAAQGATAYVTLEPCAHHGKTPPCAQALIAAGIARVVVATGDPDTRVAGRGLAMLRDAGIAVDTGVLEDPARADHAGFLLRVGDKRPLVTLKLATSLDGRIATAAGESKWITGPLARRAVHMMRARHDAVLVGAGTVRADDPSLTIRDLGIGLQPVRVVASQRLDIPTDSQLARSAQDIPLWLCHGAGAKTEQWKDLGAICLACAEQGRQIDPVDMMRQLAAQGLTRVFCEGGGSLAASLLGAGLVDRLVVMSAGMVIGAEGTPSLGAMGLEKLHNAPRFDLIDVQRLGDDVLQIWNIKRD